MMKMNMIIIFEYLFTLKDIFCVAEFMRPRLIIRKLSGKNIPIEGRPWPSDENRR